MVKKSKASPAKKKSAKTVSKKPIKKAAAKKTVSKKKAAKKSSQVKKAPVTKKKVIAKKTKSQFHKVTTASAKGSSIPKEEINNQITAVSLLENMGSNLPPVEEKSPSINETAIPAPGMDKKSVQRAATRNYDNHHIQLSNRKGGIKPSGKKPLW